jgi:hypothetical protein
VNCEAQRFDSGVPAIVLKPELTFEKQARPDSEFDTVRLHGDNTKETLLRIVRQPLAEAKPEPRVPHVYCSFAPDAGGISSRSLRSSRRQSVGTSYAQMRQITPRGWFRQLLTHGRRHRFQSIRMCSIPSPGGNPKRSSSPFPLSGISETQLRRYGSGPYGRTQNPTDAQRRLNFAGAHCHANPTGEVIPFYADRSRHRRPQAWREIKQFGQIQKGQPLTVTGRVSWIGWLPTLALPPRRHLFEQISQTVSSVSLQQFRRQTAIDQDRRLPVYSGPRQIPALARSLLSPGAANDATQDDTVLAWPHLRKKAELQQTGWQVPTS